MALAPLSSSLSFPPKKLCFFPSLRKLQEFHPSWIANPNLARRSLAPCCSSKKSSRERASKRNQELCDELREFISAMGLPENRVPSMKELCENGRKDLANIVRRRGYKAITELLLNSNGESHSDKTLEGNQDSIKANLYETAGDQEKNINVLPDRTFSSSNYSLEEDIIKSNGALLTMNDVQVCEDSEESLHLKAAKFIQTGELDTIEGEDSELYQDLASKAHEQDNKNEINDLKILLDQKEVELSQLKQQIEDEKIALSNLHDKGTAELRDMQSMIAEKDIELRAVEESLNGLKEVHITNWADGQIVEVAGSFNGWQHRVRMDLHPSSGYINPPGSRKSLLWTTVLWLYPGVYEIKFIVDGHWQIDSQREIVTSGCITNNVLRVD